MSCTAAELTALQSFTAQQAGAPVQQQNFRRDILCCFQYEEFSPVNAKGGGL